MEAARIVITCVASAVAYGIMHDQITARICVEYFTIGHPLIVPTTSPTVLGLLWGVLATWWVGLILGFGLAVAARAGRYPRRDVRELRQPVLRLLLTMAASAAISGVVGFAAASNGWVYLDDEVASVLPPSARVGFLVDLWVHMASYLAAFVGGIILIIGTWRGRRREGRAVESG